VLEPASTPTATVTAEHVWARLPQTGSSAPLIGLVGLLALATSLGFRLVRSKEML
jgi:LPXTG-motif cell wall-anchored protein